MRSYGDQVTSIQARLAICSIYAIFGVINTVSSQNLDHPVRLPASFEHGFIYLEPVTEAGDSLRFFTDTAGGSLLYEDTANDLGLVTTNAIIQNQQQEAAFLPPFDDSLFIPAPLVSDGLIPVRPNEQKPPHHHAILERGNGILGSTWFAMRAWSINYRKEELYMMPSDHGAGNELHRGGSDQIRDTDRDSVMALTFRTEDTERTHHFARLPVTIGNDTLSMVLKSGSGIVIDPETRERLKHPEAFFPAGLISESIYDRWREKNPDWRIYEEADVNYGSDIIEVPEVRLGPHKTGPVHFAVRRDDAFSDWFSRFTDEPVVGALGPDALQGAHITIDYPNSTLIFHE